MPYHLDNISRSRCLLLTTFNLITSPYPLGITTSMIGDLWRPDGTVVVQLSSLVVHVPSQGLCGMLYSVSSGVCCLISLKVLLSANWFYFMDFSLPTVTQKAGQIIIKANLWPSISTNKQWKKIFVAFTKGQRSTSDSATLDVHRDAMQRWRMPYNGKAFFLTCLFYKAHLSVAPTTHAIIIFFLKVMNFDPPDPWTKINLVWP